MLKFKKEDIKNAIDLGDDTLSFDYHGMKITITRAIHDWDVCLDVKANGANLMYNNIATKEDIELFSIVYRLACKSSSAIHASKRDEAIKHLKHHRVI